MMKNNITGEYKSEVDAVKEKKRRVRNGLLENIIHRYKKRKRFD